MSNQNNSESFEAIIVDLQIKIKNAIGNREPITLTGESPKGECWTFICNGKTWLFASLRNGNSFPWNIWLPVVTQSTRTLTTETAEMIVYHGTCRTKQ